MNKPQSLRHALNKAVPYAGLCLIVNTAPVAFGAMGIPILVAGQVTGIDSFEIGQMVGRQLPFMTIIVLFWIMAIMDGWRGIKETWPAVVVAGGSFGNELESGRAAKCLFSENGGDIGRGPSLRAQTYAQFHHRTTQIRYHWLFAVWP